MEINLRIIGVVFTVNVLACMIQYLAEKWDVVIDRTPERHSLIPGTENQKFLYWEDFWTQTWGDLVGLACVAVAFAHLHIAGRLTRCQWDIGWIVAIVGAIGFYLMCTGKNHKPDWGYPRAGEVSLGGLFHLPYFGAMLGMSVVCVWSLINGDLCGPVMWLALVGGVFYLATAVADFTLGNFDPLKLVENAE